MNFVEFFLHTIAFLTLEQDLASQTFSLFIHLRYFFLQLTLVEVVNAHVFIGLSIKLSVLLFEVIAFDSKLVYVVPQRVVLFFRLYESCDDFI